MDLTISLVNYNTFDLLKGCLDSIFKHTQGVDFEVIVVDNASSDGSVAMVKAQFPQVRLIENRENLFFTKAHNQALRLAQGRYAVILNPDLYFDENVFGFMVRFMDENPRAGAMGPRVLHPNGSLGGSGDRLPTLAYGFFEALLPNTIFPGNPVRNRRIRPDWNRDTEEEVESIGGACMLVRSSLFKEVGLLDEGFLIYWEETDWCKRIREAGYRLYFSPNVRLIHVGSAGMDQHGREKRERINFNSMVYYYKKHYGVFIGTLLRGLLAVYTYPALKAARKMKSLIRR